MSTKLRFLTTLSFLIMMTGCIRPTAPQEVKIRSITVQRVNGELQAFIRLTRSVRWGDQGRGFDYSFALNTDRDNHTGYWGGYDYLVEDGKIYRMVAGDAPGGFSYSDSVATVREFPTELQIFIPHFAAVPWHFELYNAGALIDSRTGNL